MAPHPEPIVTTEVARALADGRPIVALESTILAHGLPRPRNLEVGRRLESIVHERGAVPATIALLDGEVRVGLDAAALERVCASEGIVKASVRDLAMVVATGGDAATTVASTAWLAHQVGIRVFATGGLGGVHREATTTFDESADLTVLASVPLIVVCAGAKSVLDVPATLERLETLGVAVLGWRTDRFPGFYVTDAGIDLAWRVDDAPSVARARRAADRLGVARSIVVANPVDPDHQPRERPMKERAASRSADSRCRPSVPGADPGTGGASLICQGPGSQAGPASPPGGRGGPQVARSRHSWDVSRQIRICTPFLVTQL
jgi:pseudouridine-5'-phosphate glycosidase